MSKLATNSYVPSSRARMYLIIGMAMLASGALVYVVLSDPNSALAFFKSHAFLLPLVAILSAILSGWLQARAKMSKVGILLKFLGRGLIIFGVAAVFFLKLPDAVLVICFGLGFVL